MGFVPFSLLEKKHNLAEVKNGGEGERYFKVMELSLELFLVCGVAERGVLLKMSLNFLKMDWF